MLLESSVDFTANEMKLADTTDENRGHGFKKKGEAPRPLPIPLPLQDNARNPAKP
jgi:hypothetical protein